MLVCWLVFVLLSRVVFVSVVVVWLRLSLLFVGSGNILNVVNLRGIVLLKFMDMILGVVMVWCVFG